MIELKDSEPKQPQQQQQGSWGGVTTQNQLYKPFLRAALITVLTIGCTLGALNLAVMGFNANLGDVWSSSIQSHAYGQMFGWVGLFIMGIAYHTVPRFYLRPLRRPRLVAPSLGLVIAGLALRFVTQPFADHPLAAWLMVTSALLGFAGVSLFAWAMYDTLTGGADRFGSPASRLYLGAGFAMLWLASASTVVVTLYLATRALTVIPPDWDAPYLRAALSGAIVPIVLGYSLRTIPHMMGLQVPPPQPLRVALVAYLAGVFVQVAHDAGLLGTAGPTLAALGATAEFASLVAFVAMLHLMRLLGAPLAGLARKNPWPDRFVRTAYFWLLFAAALNFAFALSTLFGGSVPHAFVASYHHALTVGFISMMIVGMSMRLVPVFIGVMNKRPTLAGWIFGLVLAGNTARIFGQALAYLYGDGFYILMGLSGLVEVCGLAIYAWALWRALERPSYGQESPSLLGKRARPAG